MNQELATVGWREWVALPELGIPGIKAKIDTGARTSALHAFHTEAYRRNGRDRLRFAIHPLRHRAAIVIRCDVEIIDQRVVSDSGGHRERRYVIQTPLRLGDQQWSIEMTLTDRENMLFRMLLGRTALHGRLLVDVQASYLHGRSLRRVYARQKSGD